MVSPDLNDVVSLLTVARERSFTRAAILLGVSKSTLSRTVASLESRLGMPLLHRTTRSVTSTEAGQRLLDAIAPKLEEIRAELRAVSQLPKSPLGTVRISVSDYVANKYVWPKLQGLLQEHRDLHVELINDYGLSSIAAECFDIGVRLGDQVEKDMIAVRIAPDEIVAIVASPEYLQERSAPTDPLELAHHNCINLSSPTEDTPRPWELRKGRHRLDLRVDGQVAFDSPYQMLDAALKGFGLAYLPKALVEPHVQAGRLCRVLEDWCPTFPGHYAYYATRHQFSLAVRLVVGALHCG